MTDEETKIDRLITKYIKKRSYFFSNIIILYKYYNDFLLNHIFVKIHITI